MHFISTISSEQRAATLNQRQNDGERVLLFWVNTCWHPLKPIHDELTWSELRRHDRVDFFHRERNFQAVEVLFHVLGI